MYVIITTLKDLDVIIYNTEGLRRNNIEKRDLTSEGQ